MKRVLVSIVALVLPIVISACGAIEVEEEQAPRSEREQAHRNEAGKYDRTREGLFGEDGLTFFDSSKSFGNDSGSGSLGVNTYLWRATLDTISFMPVTSADPFGGVVITDWHASPESPNERFKLNVYILGRHLRADGVRVSVVRQVLDNNVWRDAAVPVDTATKIEDAFLTRARQLRNEDLAVN